MSALKAVGSSLYERVWVAKKSTVTALLLVAADAIVSGLQTEPLPRWLHIVVGLAAAVLVAYRKAQPEPEGITIPIQRPPSGGLVPVFVFACLFVGATGCTTLTKQGSTASVTIDGETLTSTINPDLTGCISKDPPFTYLGESCSKICYTKVLPFIDLTCTSATTGAVHTVTAKMVTVSP